MTFAENEIVSLLLSLGILLFFLANLARIREIGGYRYLLGSLLAYIIAMIFTLLESITWEMGFNFLEHLAYLVSAALLAAWIARLARPKRGAE
jgi:hypothetical protein